MELHQMSSIKMKGPEERRYSLPHGQSPIPIAASEDLHAWSIYRQNLNSDFTDSALGSSDKSPLPYGNFQLRDTTVQSILNHPRYGPKSPLGSNMYTYLKFGLPRVFPPNNDSQRSSSHHAVSRNNRGNVNRGYRNSSAQGFSGNGGSSGYDSSDNETTKARQPQNLRKFRSESDFRMLTGAHNSSRPSSRAHGHVSNVSAAALRKPNSRASIAGTQMNSYMDGRQYGHRSHSEADLLSNDHNRLEYETRNDMDLRNGSHEYTLSRNQSSNRGLAYPNIMVQALKISSTLRGVSLFAKAGDLFAVMATSHSEGTSLMETLAGLRERLSGEIAVNGQSVTKRNLRKICSYVPAPISSSLETRMNVQSTLYFHASLCGPEDRSDLEEKINILVEDLGLSAVRTSNVSHLTHSEKQRLSVACQLLTKASILILDQATTNMDIFDTFFLVEYLRQWCNSGKIVIMTLQPPTFEILSMCSGVLLLSGGRTIFSGSRSNLPLHMGSLGYPCPPFKNPADYYLDLVTLDDLSAAAMIESSARINVLANSWEHDNVEPAFPPPAALPVFIKRSGFLEQSITLTKRFVSYKQPESILTWISKLIAAAILSLCIGFVFWDIPASDPKLDLNDRLGYHHCIMAIGFWPLILMNVREIQMDRRFAEKDINLKLYGRTVYIVTQVNTHIFSTKCKPRTSRDRQNMECGLETCGMVKKEKMFVSVLAVNCILNFAPSLFIWLAYLLPAHSMAGLYSYTVNNDTDIYLYIGYMLLYFIVIQSITLFCSHIFSTSTISATISVLIIYLTTSVGGYVLHIQEIPFYWKWMEYVSPERWIYPVLLVNEYSHDTLTNSATQQLCRNRQVQHQEIIIQHPCPVPNGTAVLLETNLHQSFHIFDPINVEWTTLIVLIVASVLLFILVCCAFIFNCRRTNKEK